MSSGHSCKYNVFDSYLQQCPWERVFHLKKYMMLMPSDHRCTQETCLISDVQPFVYG